MNQNNKNTSINNIIMIVTGILIYYLYLKPQYSQRNSQSNSKFERFENQTTTTLPAITCPPPPTPLPSSVLSRFFGVGFNIFPASGTTNDTLRTTNKGIFIIEHIPTVYNGTAGSMYAFANNQLTLKLRNDNDPEQYWLFTKYTDTNASNPNYYTIIPNILESNTLQTQMALQYENGNLALRPLNRNFESQKWIISNNKVSRGIPILNYGPASLFTPEFNPYGSSASSNLNQQNNQQVNEVINAIKTNIQQYIDTISGTNSGNNANLPVVSASSLGNKETPLNINVNLGGAKSGFSDINNTTNGSDILSLLNKYENILKPQDNNQLLTGNDLETALLNNQGCNMLNIGDYTSNRVANCNCKL